VRGTAVLACAPGERHELGLLALAVLLQADGWLAVFLGANSPLESAFAIATRMDADVLCLSASVPETADALGTQLGLLELPARLRVVVGGPALGAAELGRPVERLGDSLAEAVVALRA
jgi:methanogenic corrinoid protein MtbC1